MKNISLTEEQFTQIRNALIAGKIGARMAKKFLEADKLLIVAQGFADDEREMEAALNTLSEALFAK